MFKMKCLISGILLVVASLFFSCSPSSSLETQALKSENELAGFLEKYIGKKKIKGGMTVLVMNESGPLYSVQKGWADRENEVLLSESTPMPVGSISKIFTAIAIMQLVEEGKVDLDESVGTYLDQLHMKDGAEYDFTVRNLLTHHSGVPGDIFKDFMLDSADPESLVSIYKILEGKPLASPAGKMFSYANIGYSLLGLIIEEQSGLSYAQYIRKEIFEVASMKDSLVYPGEREADLPIGYSPDGPMEVPAIRDNPAGSLLVSTRDMASFLGALYADQSPLLKNETLEEMLRIQNQNNPVDRDFEIGLGFWLIDPLGSSHVMASHGGDLPPYHSLLITIPDSRTAVFVSTNDHGKDGVYALDAGLQVLESYLGHDRQNEAQSIKNNDYGHSNMTGTYATAAGMIEIYENKGALKMTLMDKKLNLVAGNHGYFNVEFRLFGRFPLPIPQLKDIEIELFETSDEEAWLSLWMKGVYLGAYRKLDTPQYSDDFEHRLGNYRILNQDEGVQGAVSNIHIAQNDERYTICIDFLGQGMEYALRSIDENQAVTDGAGRGMGDLLFFKEEGDHVFLEWSGFQLIKED